MSDNPRATSTLITAPDDDDPRALAQRIVAEVLARHRVPAQEVADAAADARTAPADVRTAGADDAPVDETPVSDAVRLARSIVADVLQDRGLDEQGRQLDAVGPPPLPADAIVVTAPGQDDVALDGAALDDGALEDALADPATQELTVSVGGVAVRLLEDGDHVEAAAVVPPAPEHEASASEDELAARETEVEAPGDPDDPAVIARRLVRETLEAAAARAEAEAVADTEAVEDAEVVPDVEDAEVLPAAEVVPDVEDVRDAQDVDAEIEVASDAEVVAGVEEREVGSDAEVVDDEAVADGELDEVRDDELTVALFVDHEQPDPAPETATGSTAAEDEATRSLEVDGAGSTAALPVEDEPTVTLQVEDTRSEGHDGTDWDDLDEPAPGPAEEPVAEWRWESEGSTAVPADEPARAETPTDGVDLATLPPPEASPSAVLRSLDAPQPRGEARESRTRTGRWLLVTFLGAVGLALLLPLTVQALRTLITLN